MPNPTTDLDKLLQGTKYAGAAKGKWFAEHRQVEYESWSTELFDEGNQVIAEFEWHSERTATGFKTTRDANAALCADAKKNACLAQLVGPLVEALENIGSVQPADMERWGAEYTVERLAVKASKAARHARTVMAIVDGEK